MFRFLKGIFKKEAVIERHEVSTADLDRWFEDRTAPILEEFRKRISGSFSAISIIKNTLQENTAALENAEIPEPDRIQEKVKQVVTGHRNLYVKRLKQFISSVNLPENADYKTMLEYSSAIEAELNNFSTNTTKTYYAVQHLFYKPLEEITKALRDLDINLNEIKRCTEERHIHTIEELKTRISTLQSMIKKKETLGRQIGESKARLAENANAKAETIQAIAELEQGSDFAKMNALNNDLNGVKKEIEGIESEVVQIFAPLERSLRKYAKTVLENESLIDEYAAAPVKALLHDDTLKILKILQAMQKAIDANAIELEDKKKEKAIAAINAITADNLKEIASRHRHLHERAHSIERQLKANKAAQQKKELDYRIEHTDWMAAKLNDSIAKLEQETAKINIDNAKPEIENALKSILNVDVKIT